MPLIIMQNYRILNLGAVTRTGLCIGQYVGRVKLAAVKQIFAVIALGVLLTAQRPGGILAEQIFAKALLRGIR